MGLPIKNPTYLLPPNFNFRLGGPISLGNIITNPFKPHIVLSTPDPNRTLPATCTAQELNRKLVAGNERNLNLSLWVAFLEVARIKIAANHENQRRTTYATGTLETVYFKDVTIDLICESVKDPKVAQLLNPKHFLSRPMYMITAVKIAKGLQLQSYRGRESGGHAGIGGLSDGPIGAVGLEATTAGQSSEVYKSHSHKEVVFAYQLLKIAPKGWGKGDLQLIEYQSPAASLGSGGDNGEQKTTEDFEASYFGTLDKDDSGGQGADINVIKTTDDEGNEVNIVSLANTQGHGAGTRRDGEDVRPIQETNNSTQLSRLLKAWKLIN